MSPRWSVTSGVTAISFFSATGLTMTVITARAPLAKAKICVLPALTAVTVPLEETTATLGSALE